MCIYCGAPESLVRAEGFQPARCCADLQSLFWSLSITPFFPLIFLRVLLSHNFLWLQMEFADFRVAGWGGMGWDSRLNTQHRLDRDPLFAISSSLFPDVFMWRHCPVLPFWEKFLMIYPILLPWVFTRPQRWSSSFWILVQWCYCFCWELSLATRTKRSKVKINLKYVQGKIHHMYLTVRVWGFFFPPFS